MPKPIPRNAPLTMLRTLRLAVRAIVLTAAVWAGEAAAEPGGLDPSFDVDGRVTINISSTSFSTKGRDVAIQTDGKIVVVGDTSNGFDTDFVVARYQANGSPDLSFGREGFVLTNFGSGDVAHAVALQADGKIVVAGVSGTGNDQTFALARYNSDGNLDPTFSSDGLVTTDVLGYGIASAVAVQSDGKIVAVGETGGNWGVVRYNTNGSLDTSFDTDGKVTTVLSAGRPCVARSVAIQSDGKIVVAGYSEGPDVFGVARYNSNGSLDTSFDADGKVVTAFSGNAYGTAVKIQSDGKLVVAGSNNGNYAVARYSANGSLDASFDGDGMATFDFASGEGLSDLAIQSNGRIVASGTSGFTSAFATLRLNTNGSLDTTFDVDGIVTTSLGGQNSIGSAVALDSTGRIVVLGHVLATPGGVGVARYLSNGSLDTAFDGDGTVTAAPPFRSEDEPYAVAVQADGKIVVAGFTVPLDNFDYDFLLARYNIDGTLDTTFDGDGLKAVDLSGFDDVANAVAIQPDGKIVAAGYADGNVGLVRLNTNGSLDTTFDTDGKVVTAAGSSSSYGDALQIQTDGRIVVAGGASDGGLEEFAIVRYNSNGSLDPNFSGDGIAKTNIGTGHDAAYALAIQADGKIVAVGQASSAGNSDFALVRYQPDGSLDTSFDGDGKLTTSFDTYDYATSVALQPDGRIVAAGGSYGVGSSQAVLARYNTNGSLDSTFDTDGKVATDLGGDGTDFYDIAIQVDGSIVAVGEASNGVTFEFVVARYTVAGGLDTSFSFDGKLSTGFGGDEAGARAVAIQSNGRIVVAGASYYTRFGHYDADIAVARYLVATCGDGDLEIGEMCDDGNLDNDDRCDDECELLTDCPLVPSEGCLGTVKAQLDVSYPSQKLKWKWGGGDAFDQNDLGVPAVDTSYTLCVYDSSDDVYSLATWMRIDPSATNWLDKSPKGLNFKDRNASPDGITKGQFKTGTLGKSKVQFSGGGLNLPLSAPVGFGEYFDQSPGVMVQLLNDDGTCWTSLFDAADTRTNDIDGFKAASR